MPEMRQYAGYSHREIRGEGWAAVLGVLGVPQVPNHAEHLECGKVENRSLSPISLIREDKTNTGQISFETRSTAKQANSHAN